MGYGYDAICQRCGEKFRASEGPGDERGPLALRSLRQGVVVGVPTGSTPPCAMFLRRLVQRGRSAAMPELRSVEITQDPDGVLILYD